MLLLSFGRKFAANIIALDDELEVFRKRWLADEVLDLLE